MFDCESLRDYHGESVHLRLPGSLDIKDVFWFSGMLALNYLFEEHWRFFFNFSILHGGGDLLLSHLFAVQWHATSTGSEWRTGKSQLPWLCNFNLFASRGWQQGFSSPTAQCESRLVSIWYAISHLDKPMVLVCSLRLAFLYGPYRMYLGRKR